MTNYEKIMYFFKYITNRQFFISRYSTLDLFDDYEIGVEYNRLMKKFLVVDNKIRGEKRKSIQYILNTFDIKKPNKCFRLYSEYRDIRCCFWKKQEFVIFVFFRFEEKTFYVIPSDELSFIIEKIQNMLLEKINWIICTCSFIVLSTYIMRIRDCELLNDKFFEKIRLCLEMNKKYVQKKLIPIYSNFIFRLHHEGFKL